MPESVQPHNSSKRRRSIRALVGKETRMYIGVRPSALTDQDVAELKARHLACSHLIKGSQDAIIRLRNRTASTPEEADLSLECRATEILEDVVGSWCETLSILRSALNGISSQRSARWQRAELDQSVFTRGSRPPSVDAAYRRRG